MATKRKPLKRKKAPIKKKQQVYTTTKVLFEGELMSVIFADSELGLIEQIVPVAEARELESDDVSILEINKEEKTARIRRYGQVLADVVIADRVVN